MLESYDPAQRAEEKQEARDRDEQALASGEKNQEQLRRENGAFTFPHARIELKAVAR